jgi:hypothetical protein
MSLGLLFLQELSNRALGSHTPSVAVLPVFPSITATDIL